MAVKPVSEWLDSEYLPGIVRRVASAYGVPPDLIPDLTQEFLLALWKSGPERPVNATWLFSVARNKAVDLLRSESGFGVGLEVSSGAFLDPEPRLLLGAQVSRLPEDLRRFYNLRYEQGHSQREVAKLTGLSRGAVRMLERRCRHLMTGAAKAIFFVLSGAQIALAPDYLVEMQATLFLAA